MSDVAEGLVAGAPAVVPAAAGSLDPATATTGQRLKAARERRGLSSQKAADKMHLDLWVIEALESDQFDKIGPSVYAKGHLKRYAGMLGLPAAEIMAAYGAPPAAVAAQRGAMRLRTQEPVGIELPWATIAAAAIAALAISGVVWLRPWRSRNPSPVPPPTAEQAGPRLAGPRQAAPSPAAADTTVNSAGDEMQVGSSVAADSSPIGAAVPTTETSATRVAPATAAAVASTAPASTAPVSTAPASPGGGKAQLRLSFSADSWVEVHDAAGKPVFVGNGRANSVKSLGGDAPLRVYLRSASGVQLTINNHVVAIGPQFVAGDVARFEAGADGVLRHDTHEPHPHG